VCGIERLLDGDAAVALFALRDVALGELQIIQDAVGVGPLLEQVIVLEEVVMAERGMRDHKRLHGRRILFHQVGNARRAVDHDLVGQAFQPLAIHRLLMRKMLAERPMLVE
jgi:hypothetical protein